MTAGSTSTLDGTARGAVASACDEVYDAGPGDAVDGVQPALVARPSDAAQVAEVLAATAAHGLAVVVRGRGTKITWGLPPPAVDVLLDTSAMDRVLDHAAGDLIVEAQAGARLADVQAALATAGQRLAIDETVPGASIGGTIATNASGARRLATGTARDLLIGISVVRADGVAAKAGGRVVKNVAGYDLGKLMVGSFGTLAVVTSALFRLHPVPVEGRWLTVPVPDASSAHEAVQSVLHSQCVPAALEVEWSVTGEATVSVLLEGRPDGVEGRSRTVRSLLGERVSQSAHAPADGATYPWDVTATGDERAVALKLTFALSGLPDVLAAARDGGVAVRGSAGTGVAYGALPADTPVDAVGAAVDRLRAVCGGHGGGLVVLDAPAVVKRSVDVWGPVPAADLMRRVKDRFDPDRRLAPGRFAGGI
jgi:glycolate oxidase FAD binding subunit